MQYVIDSWGDLNNEDRVKVVSLISDLKEKKSISQDMDSCEKGA